MNLSQLLGPHVDPEFVAAAEHAQGVADYPASTWSISTAPVTVQATHRRITTTWMLVNNAGSMNVTSRVKWQQIGVEVCDDRTRLAPNPILLSCGFVCCGDVPMRFYRTLSEAFSDERAWCIESPRGIKSGFYLCKRSWLQRVLMFFGWRR